VAPQQVLDWTAQFNQIVKDGVAGMAGVVLIDSGEPINDAIANPAKYGLVDVRKPGCTKTTPTASATFCTKATLAAHDSDQTYLWSDAFHLSPRGHKIVSDLALGRLDGVARPRP
jgi:phospholipase/lecithinase/hemolysin